MYSMISYWLKYYRHECGLTQQQVADRLKIERSTYTYYETGKTKPDINTLIKIAKVYDINYQKLLTIATSTAHTLPQNMRLSFCLWFVISIRSREKK